MTMEIDALYAGQPMRNSLDPCNTCAEWLALKAENDRLRAELTEAITALPQAVRNERERCARECQETAERYLRGNFGEAAGACTHLASRLSGER